MKNKIRFITLFGMTVLIGMLLMGCAQKSAPQTENDSGTEIVEEQAEEMKQDNSSQQTEGANQDNGSQQTEGANQGDSGRQAAEVVKENEEKQEDAGLEQAKDAALTNAGLEASQVTFTKAELDYDDGRDVYDIEFVTSVMKYEYEIKADDYSVLEMSKEAIEQIGENGQRTDLITLEEAKAIALSYVEISEEEISYTKLELEYDDGIAEYEVEFYAGGKEYSLTIDAVSGVVSEMEME